MENEPKGWTKEEYLEHLRRPANERNKETAAERAAFQLVLFPRLILPIVFAVLAAVFAVLF